MRDWQARNAPLNEAQLALFSGLPYIWRTEKNASRAVLLAAGVLLAALGGVAAAEAPVLVFAGYDGLTNTEMPAEQPTADPELQYSNTLPWQRPA